MQDRYVGDIGDFANNGLLRWLCGKPELPLCHPDSPQGKLRLGVVWCRHTNERSNGGLIGYLSRTPENDSEFRRCDPYLYDSLKELVFRDNRTIEAVEESGILPATGRYFIDNVPYDKAKTTKPREEERKTWLEGALNATRKADLVFFDPDNGLVCGRTSRFSPKHISINELKPFVDRCQSLVVYQHFIHHKNYGDATKQIRDHSQRLKNQLGRPDIRIRALQYHRGTKRFYFIVIQPCHKEAIDRRLQSFGCSPWCQGRKPQFTYHQDPET